MIKNYGEDLSCTSHIVSMIIDKSKATYYSYRKSSSPLISSKSPSAALHLMQVGVSDTVRRVVTHVRQPIILLQHLDSMGCLATSLHIRQLNDLKSKNIAVIQHGKHIYMNFTSYVKDFCYGILLAVKPIILLL